MDNGRDKLDELIDSALASYSGAEPRLGMEARVVSRVRATRVRRRMLEWGLAFGVASAVVVVALIRTEPRTISKPVDVARVMSAQERPPTIRPVAKLRPAMRARRPQALPKLEQFPSPMPLTAEERALVAFVERDPTEAQQVFSDLQKRTDGLVEIQPIQIAPLQSDGAQ